MFLLQAVMTASLASACRADDTGVTLAASTADAAATPDTRVPDAFRRLDAGLTGDECAMGLYQGAATGSISVPGFGVLPGNASMDFRLGAEPGGDPEFPKITAGKLTGTACDPSGAYCFPYTADLAGTLDCNTRMLKDGRIENGMVTGTAYTFTGTLTAAYDATRFVDGTWMGMDANGLGATASGLWVADWKSE